MRSRLSLPKRNINILLNRISVVLGAFAKLRKASISVVMSVRMEQLGYHWTYFHEVLYLSIFPKSVEKIQV